MTLYSIKVAPTKYVTYCEGNILEASDSPLYTFTREDCDKVAEKLKERYIYDVILLGNDGAKERIDSLKVKETSEKKQEIIYTNDECFEL